MSVCAVVIHTGLGATVQPIGEVLLRLDGDDRLVSGSVDREEIVAQIVGKLTAKHPQYDRDDVERTARAELAELESSPVQDFLLVLTEWATKKRLKRR